MKNKFINNLFVILVFAFLYLPIIVLIIYSFNTSSMNIIFDGFTFDWYKTLFHNSDLLEAFRNTLIVAVISTVISTILGTISAYGLFKYITAKDYSSEMNVVLIIELIIFLNWKQKYLMVMN